MTEAWDAGAEQTLLQLWNDGISASGIGDRLGLSRNAVLGKIHRLRLRKGKRAVAVRVAIHATKPGPKRKPKPKAPTPRQPGISNLPPARTSIRSREFRLSRPIELEPPPMPDPKPTRRDIGLLELTDATCRWPNDGPPWLFCGAPVEEGRRYCAHHHLRATTRVAA